MKKFKITSLSVLLILVLIILSKNVQALPEDSSEEKIQIIENILLNRMRIMKEGLFETKDLDEVEEELMKFEKGKILENDLSIIKELREYPAGFEYPEGLEITKFELLKESGNSEMYKINILWKISGFDKNYDEAIEYNIKVIYEENSGYLVEFKPFDM